MSIQAVNLRIRGKQSYEGQEPEVIELLTEGTMEHVGDTWVITYEESDLTGLSGVTTTFCIGPRGITLKRTGRLQSQMIFRLNQRHESLYQLDIGALMICVCARKIRYDLTGETGGTVDLVYTIEIEESAAGTVDYHLDIIPRS